MIPLSLELEDFMIYKHANLDFTNCHSGILISGTTIRDPNESNAVGKTTLMKAIEYALFDECDVNIAKIIRKNTKKARVKFSFEKDNKIYKIENSRTKSSVNINFYELVNDEWVSKNSNKNSSVKEEILKVIGISRDAFNQVLWFSQEDFTGIINGKTPKEKIDSFKNVINLTIYSKILNKIKEENTNLNKEIFSITSEIKFLGEPDKDLTELTSKVDLTKSLISSKEDAKIKFISSLEEIKQQISNIVVNTNNVTTLNEISKIENLLLVKDKELKQLQEKKNNLQNKIDELNKNNYTTDLKTKQNLLKTKREYNFIDINQYNLDINQLNSDINSLKLNISLLETEIKKLSKVLPGEEVCPECFQSITEDYKKTHQEKCNTTINFNKQEIISLKEKLNKKAASITEKQNKINEQNNIVKEISNIENSIKLLENNIKNNNESILLYNSNINEHNDSILVINEQIVLYKQNLVDLNKSLIKDDSLDLMNKLKEEEKSLSKKIEDLTNSLLQGNSNLIILNDKILNKTQDLTKQNQLKISLNKLQETLDINSIIMEASGPSGIPNMIIYNLLDDFQVYINNWLSKLRNNLEFKFVVSKVKSDSSEVDTFDCLYYSKGEEFSYKELSGGQKHIVKLAVKMGFVDLLEEKFNMSIGMLCFDEVDERLDKSASDALTSLIKILEKKYKVFVITHKDTLQTKFLHNILVTQEDDGSVAILRNNV